jgi:hypothetical protein
MPFCLWMLSYPPKQLPWFSPLHNCDLIVGLWILTSWVGRGCHFCTLRCSLMFRFSELCDVHVSQINLRCRTEKISAINVWRITSQTPYPNQSINVTRCFILDNGLDGQFQVVDIVQRTYGLELVSGINPATMELSSCSSRRRELSY